MAVPAGQTDRRGAGAARRAVGVGSVVDHSVAVVVGVGMNLVVGLVAVTAAIDTTGGDPAGRLGGRRGVTVPIAVGIGPGRHQQTFVDLAVAVVVDVVAHLAGGGVHPGARVVAVVP